MNIIAFGASNSTTSINKALATYAASQIESASVEVLDLNDFEMPIFSSDREKESGHPELAKAFLSKIQSADAIIISFAEHNGSYSAAYKNIFDWCSRVQAKVFDGKKVVLLSTSPGPSGAGSVLNSAVGSMPFFGAQVVGHFSLPSFYDHFDMATKEVKTPEHVASIKELVSSI